MTMHDALAILILGSAPWSPAMVGTTRSGPAVRFERRCISLRSAENSASRTSVGADSLAMASPDQRRVRELSEDAFLCGPPTGRGV